MSFTQTNFGRRTFQLRRHSILGCRTWIMACLACLLLGGSLSHADTVGYWRFGDDGDFLNDSGPNNLDLRHLGETDVEDVAGIDSSDQGEATQEMIPGTGPGSTFGDAVSGNAQMAQNFPGSNKASGFAVADDANVFGVSDFTIEALIHRQPDPNRESPVWSIAGQYSSNGDEGFLAPNGRSWKFQVRDNENASNFGQLFITLSGDDTTFEGIDSGLTLGAEGDFDRDVDVDGDDFLVWQRDIDTDDPPGTAAADLVSWEGDYGTSAVPNDYYVAASFDLSNQTDGVTFYVKDLTGGGPMQIAKLGHTQTTLFDAEGPFWIASGFNPRQGQGEGFLDEVRFSNEVLDPSQLLVPVVTPAIAPVPEPASWILVCTMALAAARLRRRS